MTRNHNKSISIFKSGQALEKGATKKLNTSLLSSFDGTEIMHQTLLEGGRWGLAPSVSSRDSLEAVYVLSGKLTLKLNGVESIIEPHDYVAAEPVKEHLIFKALEDTTFLYVASEPVFHYYSKATEELKELAVAIEKKDGYTADHCQRIKEMSMLVGEKMNLNSSSLQNLNFGAFLHDIGKTRVPTSILQKPGKLTNEEWEIMKLHTVYGAEILRYENSPHLIKAADIVEQHHERYDGSGYPKGLKGNEIAVEAAIVGLVDSFDAITSDRVYQKSRSKADALKEIKSLRGILYNPDVVDAFMSVMTSIPEERRV